jgi:hypothetical protein
MPTFEIESYKVSSEIKRTWETDGAIDLNRETHLNRILEMVGPVLFPGIQNRAAFMFSTSYDPTWWYPGHITDPAGPPGLVLHAGFPLGEFSYYYDILRSERPLHVFYEYMDEGVTKGTGYLRAVGLGTSNERIGEGPSESIKEISKVLTELLIPVGAMR